MQVTKRQHYLPESYLSGFSDLSFGTDKFVWAYNKSINRIAIPTRATAVSSICHEEFYYSQTEQGDDILEKKLGTLEGKVAPLLKTLGTDHAQLVVTLTAHDRELLALFIGLSFTRVQSFREPVEELHKWAAERTLDHLIDNDLLPPPPKELEGKLDQLQVQVQPFISLPIMIAQAEQVAQSLLQKDWQFFKATGQHTFITGDNPVIWSTGGRDLIGVAHPLSEVYFPIRRDMALVCTNKGFDRHIYQTAPSKIKMFNRDIAKAARKYIISDKRSEGLARLAYKYRGHEQKVQLS